MENIDELTRAKKLFSHRLGALIRSHGIQQNVLADAIGVSESTIGKWLLEKALPRMGAIQKLSDYFSVPKSYFLIEENEQEENTPQPKRKYVKIPVLGRVVAGVPSEAVENVLDYEEIPEEMARGGEYFGLEVYGDSMEPTLQEGDVVIVKKQYEARPHDIAVVMVNGDEATIKEVKITEDGITLVGHNIRSYTPRFYSAREVAQLPVKIIGVVCEVRRKFSAYYRQ